MRLDIKTKVGQHVPRISIKHLTYDIIISWFPAFVSLTCYNSYLLISGTLERGTSAQVETVAMSPQPGPSHVREDPDTIEELVVVSIEDSEEDE